MQPCLESQEAPTFSSTAAASPVTSGGHLSDGSIWQSGCLAAHRVDRPSPRSTYSRTSTLHALMELSISMTQQLQIAPLPV